jgi:hypothetical protein
MAGPTTAHPTVADRRARGKQARDRTPLVTHTGWMPAVDRPDPAALLQEQDACLQVKEATASVLEDHQPKSRYQQHGERVVQGSG